MTYFFRAETAPLPHPTPMHVDNIEQQCYRRIPEDHADAAVRPNIKNLRIPWTLIAPSPTPKNHPCERCPAEPQTYTHPARGGDLSRIHEKISARVARVSTNWDTTIRSKLWVGGPYFGRSSVVWFSIKVRKR